MAQPVQTAQAAAYGKEGLAANVAARILGASQKALGAASASFSAAAATTFTPEAGNYTLSVIYYIFFFLFIAFLIALLVHFTISPVFRFIPGGKGLIGVPGVPSGKKVYWNDKTQPPPDDKVPKQNDDLDSYDFTTDFTFSVDLLVRKVPQTAEKNRLILYMGNRTPPTDTISPMQTGPTTDQTLINYLTPTATVPINPEKASMVMYLTETNDLIVSFYSTSNNPNSQVGIWYNSGTIKNIPLYTPFRVGVIVEKNNFTVYLNNQQVFQRLVSKGLGNKRTSPQRFYAAPAWAQQPRQTAFVQNLMVWDRALQYSELKAAQPALATVPDFDAPAEPDSGSCT